MKYIHFSILDKTLCGKEDEPVPQHLADSRRFCNDCVQVVWREQYRRDISVRQEIVSEEVIEIKQQVVTPLVETPRPIKTLRHYLKVEI